EVALFFKETGPGEVRVGFRSKRRVDVSQLAQEFGGGGHPRAAGCTFHGTLEQAVDQIVARAVQLAGDPA
ncbi:MAG TPA: DHHA1 domain-containing protein, partial [Limnochordia bacterium]|nr:DHHA1 domain-containing protein [Limnochordia bacterium]